MSPSSASRTGAIRRSRRAGAAAAHRQPEPQDGDPASLAPAAAADGAYAGAARRRLRGVEAAGHRAPARAQESLRADEIGLAAPRKVLGLARRLFAEWAMA